MDAPPDRQVSISPVPTSTETGYKVEQVISSTPLPNLVKPLEFVLATPSEGREPDTRKKVRAHVMRDYHRTRRMAETKSFVKQKRLESAATLGLKPRPAEKQKGPEHQNDSENVWLQPFWNISPRVALPYQDNKVPHVFFVPDGPMMYVRPPKWPSNKAFSTWRQHLDTSGCVNSLFPRHSMWMPNWIRPQEGPIRGPLLFGDVLSFLMTTPECMAFRLETIKWIQAQLQNKETATGEETMGAIMILAMWEPGVGSSQLLRAHMDGLENLVHLKGGIHDIQNPHLVTRLIIFDFLIAVSCSASIRFSSVACAAPPFLPQPTASQLTTSNTNPLINSPLCGNGDFASITCAWRKKDIIYILETMHGLTNFVLSTPSTTWVSKRQKKTKQLISKSQLSLKPPSISTQKQATQVAKNTNSESETRVFDTIHCASQIYQRALSTPPIQFTSPQNEQDIQELYESMSASVSDGFWKRYTGIWMWVLCVGCATSSDRMERPYWMHLLSKVLFAFSGGRPGWIEITGALRKFLEVQERIRKSL
ncbi:uncharacterized protein LY89DRAFT_195693 [Mollisia scopiformis]|uniref:Tachykinin family protein n=1 Tax=Mollisia scopiformis TaxID=149040 RepID=A0A194WY23_MOLSC|nr:uncharacterized protein LY89DRAFT_195693 [Mollisia scopiformis]KUJ12873.1 hypothetical protein LY89DRAFT_195693 [Mollisia scopiformis]